MLEAKARPGTSPFAMTMLTDPRRVSHVIYGILRQQQCTFDRIQSGEISMKNILNMAAINQSSPQSLSSVDQAQLSGIKPMSKQSTQVITKPTKLLPRTVRFDGWGFSAQVVALPKDKGKSYQAAVHLSLLGKMYTVQLQMSCPDLSFDRMLHVRNIVPTDSAMTVACRTGDFDSARKLLASGAAHGSDITLAGWPMLDVGVKSLCIRLCDANDTGSMLLRAGLPGSSACSLKMELNRTWRMGSIICECGPSGTKILPVMEQEPLLTGCIAGRPCNLPSFEDTSTLPDFF